MAQYGLGQAAADVTAGIRGAEKEAEGQRRYDAQEQRAQAQEQRTTDLHGVTMEARKQQLDAMRRKAAAEGMTEATKLLLSGRLSDAEAAWNSRGSQKIKPGSLNYNQKTGIVRWTEVGPNGEEIPGEAKDKMLAAIAGVRWTDATGKSGQAPASIQLLDRYTEIFGDRKKAAYILNMSKTNPAAATARVYATLAKANEAKMFDAPDKMTEDQLWAKAKEMVIDAQKAVGKSMYGIDDGTPAPVPAPGADAGGAGGVAQESKPIIPDDPATWGNLW